MELLRVFQSSPSCSVSPSSCPYYFYSNPSKGDLFIPFTQLHRGRISRDNPRYSMAGDLPWPEVVRLLAKATLSKTIADSMVAHRQQEPCQRSCCHHRRRHCWHVYRHRPDQAQQLP